LVVGGGIGGLTAAVAFRRHGIAVDLVEIRPDHNVYGVGIIQPNNTLRALQHIGLADACVARGGSFPGWKIFDQHGKLLVTAPTDNGASPGHPAINGITRPILQEILVEAAIQAGARLKFGLTVKRFLDAGDQVNVVFTDGQCGAYDLLVGCDGIYSSIREQLFPRAPKPQFSGQCVWRYNFERPVDVDWGAIFYGARTKVGLVPMSPTLMYMFLVSAEAGNPRMPADQLAELMRARLEGFSGLVARLREQIDDPAAVVYKPMEHLMLASPWMKGRAIVIGDAAHATTPHLAQGAAMAIEDAVLLAELMARDAATVPALLEEFMRRRFERAQYVVDCSRQIADWEMEQWNGIENPGARPGQLLGEATHRLQEPY
jgi:2-polyprenyl-6-methoxyphenol hydroxylase-like FAD-dependent oxidoreductase